MLKNVWQSRIGSLCVLMWITLRICIHDFLFYLTGGTRVWIFQFVNAAHIMLQKGWMEAAKINIPLLYPIYLYQFANYSDSEASHTVSLSHPSSSMLVHLQSYDGHTHTYIDLFCSACGINEHKQIFPSMWIDSYCILIAIVLSEFLLNAGTVSPAIFWFFRFFQSKDVRQTGAHRATHWQDYIWFITNQTIFFFSNN